MDVSDALRSSLPGCVRSSLPVTNIPRRDRWETCSSGGSGTLFTTRIWYWICWKNSCSFRIRLSQPHRHLEQLIRVMFYVWVQDKGIQMMWQAVLIPEKSSSDSRISFHVLRVSWKFCQPSSLCEHANLRQVFMRCEYLHLRFWIVLFFTPKTQCASLTLDAGRRLSGNKKVRPYFIFHNAYSEESRKKGKRDKKCFPWTSLRCENQKCALRFLVFATIPTPSIQPRRPMEFSISISFLIYSSHDDIFASFFLQTQKFRSVVRIVNCEWGKFYI